MASPCLIDESCTSRVESRCPYVGNQHPRGRERWAFKYLRLILVITTLLPLRLLYRTPAMTTQAEKSGEYSRIGKVHISRGGFPAMRMLCECVGCDLELLCPLIDSAAAITVTLTLVYSYGYPHAVCKLMYGLESGSILR